MQGPNPKERMNRSYIDNKLSLIFEPLVSAIFQEKPEDHVTIYWLIEL